MEQSQTTSHERNIGHCKAPYLEYVSSAVPSSPRRAQPMEFGRFLGNDLLHLSLGLTIFVRRSQQLSPSSGFDLMKPAWGR